MGDRQDAGVRTEAAMRVQLQQQHGGRTLHHASRVLQSDGGVSTEQLTVALQDLRGSRVIPGREQAGADAALRKAMTWIEARPPNGVFGRFSKSFYFDPLHPRETWRFDIEGLSGVNLVK